MRFSKRHIVKSFTWRFIGTIDTLVFSWLITGEFNESLNLSGITTFTKLLWYYIHERLWFNSLIKDSNKRHILKTFTWRGVGTLDTVFFGWLITGSPMTGLKIGAVEMSTKMLLYFGHEKMWYKVNYGLDKRNRLKHLNKLRARRKIHKS